MLVGYRETTPTDDVRSTARDSLFPEGHWGDFGKSDVVKFLAFADEYQEESGGSASPITFCPEVHLPIQTTIQKCRDDKATTVEDNPLSLSPTGDAGLQELHVPAEEEMAIPTCVPRSSLSRRRRPFELELDDSRGATSIEPSDLRHLIRTTSLNGVTSISSRVQVIDHQDLPSPIASKGRKKYFHGIPSLRATTLTVRLPASQPPEVAVTRHMGNQQSHHAATHDSYASAGALYSSAEETESSVDSVLPSQKMRSQKSGHKHTSMSILKKRSSKNAASHFTATVIEVPRAATAPNLDLIGDVDAEAETEEDEEVPVRKDVWRTRHGKTLSAPSPALQPQPGSPATVIESYGARPLSAATTITALSLQDHSYDHMERSNSSPQGMRVSALSPTIPAPSPVPEDSPHQYGLKDFTSTPTPPRETDAKKLRRRSNDVDMFNDAKSLQTAASFLNGLSNARRRAESRAGPRTQQRYQNQSNHSFGPVHGPAANLPYSHRPADLHNTSAFRSLTSLPLADSPSPIPSSPPLSPKLDNVSRSLGHGHRSSGFAYAKALSIVQLRCYRQHDRLLRSGNANYPVECAICHCDEAGDYYWSCSWCAVRMCGGCRNVFRQHGIKALENKTRAAEHGARSLGV